MNDELMEIIPTFRVIGVGQGVEEIIEKVKSFGFDGVSMEIVTPTQEVHPSDTDQLAVIIFIDNEDTANLIAKSFHQDGVLTLGLSEAADPSCFDSILKGVKPAEYPDVVKAVLQIIFKNCLNSFDFYDLSNFLRNSGYFVVKKVIGKTLREATRKMQEELKDIDFHVIENLTFNIFLHSENMPPIDMKEMRIFHEMLTALPDTINVAWAIHFDDELSDDQIGLISILTHS